jgi:hypothetical protein
MCRKFKRILAHSALFHESIQIPQIYRNRFANRRRLRRNRHQTQPSLIITRLECKIQFADNRVAANPGDCTQAGHGCSILVQHPRNTFDAFDSFDSFDELGVAACNQTNPRNSFRPKHLPRNNSFDADHPIIGQ